MKYLIYKITNTINGRYYIGRHATNNVDDNYMGSGKAIKNAIKKYGIEYFTKEIIAEANSAENLWELERQIVNDIIVKDPLSYNMTYGGRSYLDGLKKYDSANFLQHQSKSGKIGSIEAYKKKTIKQRKDWHRLGGIANAQKQKLSGSHPFYTGEAARAGGKAIKGMIELWNPNAIATNKNQKQYKPGDCKRVNPKKSEFYILIQNGWLPINEHKQRCRTW